MLGERRQGRQLPRIDERDVVAILLPPYESTSTRRCTGSRAEEIAVRTVNTMNKDRAKQGQER